MKEKLRAVRYGPDAWLLSFANHANDEAWYLSRSLTEILKKNTLPNIAEWTLSPTALLLEFIPGHSPEKAPFLDHLIATAENTVSGEKLIPVHYNGPDLARVAAHCGISIDEVIRLHCAADYRVHALGFAPGFAYLGGLPECLNTPRLDSPRMIIPAGAVAIGGSQTAVYPLPTPGGWNIIGSTTIPMFDPEKPIDQAFFLQPGDTVHFERHD